MVDKTPKNRPRSDLGSTLHKYHRLWTKSPRTDHGRTWNPAPQTSGSSFSSPLSTTRNHPVERAIKQMISYRPRSTDRLVGYREANRITLDKRASLSGWSGLTTAVAICHMHTCFCFSYFLYFFSFMNWINDRGRNLSYAHFFKCFMNWINDRGRNLSSIHKYHFQPPMRALVSTDL